MSPSEIKHLENTLKHHIGLIIMKKDNIWIRAFSEFNNEKPETEILSMRFFNNYKTVLKYHKRL